jgi:hypothetical protein
LIGERKSDWGLGIRLAAASMRRKQYFQATNMNYHFITTTDLCAWGVTWWIVGWIACIVAGACAGSGKSSAITGAILGALLGPLGVLAALGLDGRERCPGCAGRVDGEGDVCQHCRLPLVWSQRDGKPYYDKSRRLTTENEHIS